MLQRCLGCLEVFGVLGGVGMCLGVLPSRLWCLEVLMRCFGVLFKCSGVFKGVDEVFGGVSRC